MSETTGKTVYVLGAGFSKPAGIPTQAKLIEKIYSDNLEAKYILNKEEITKFLVETQGYSKESISNLALEDIFTPIDKAIIDQVSLKDYSEDDLVLLRRKLVRLIKSAIQESNKENSTEYIETFSKHIIAIAREKLDKKDKVAIITTNWDSLLDNILHNQLKIDFKTHIKSLKPTEKEMILQKGFVGVVDYCCYMSSYKKDKSIRPGLYALGAGGYNVKLLKLHGSTNWQMCPRCHRLYVGFFKEPRNGFPSNSSGPCGYCKEKIKEFKTNVFNKDSIQLGSVMIMPTNVKDLDNYQIKMIWRNAGIEIFEADELVFIGYSLPFADFEFRQMILRSIRPGTRVKVILHQDIEEGIINDPCIVPQVSLKEATSGYRYMNFFNGYDLKISYKGVKNYVNNLQNMDYFEWDFIQGSEHNQRVVQ